MGAENTNKKIGMLGFFGVWGYMFFSIVPYAVAGKHISTALMLFAFVVLLLRKQIRVLEFNWLSTSVFAVVALALASAILSPYSVESLNQLRKDGVPFLVGFLLLTCTKSSDFSESEVVKYTFASIIFGYAVKEVMALWAGATNQFEFSIYEFQNQGVAFPRYMEFFAADTPFYLPFLLGPLFFWPIKTWQRFLLIILTSLAIGVVVVSGVRTAFAFVGISLYLIFIVRLWHYKKLMLSVILSMLVLTYLLIEHSDNTSIARYKTILSSQTYKFGNDGSVSERYSIVKGVWEVSKDRLLIGYGPGWKKLPTVAEDNGHMDRWRRSTEAIDKGTLNYFSNGEGRVNPHNFYAALLFEGGLLGLGAYISLMFASAFGVLKLCLKQSDSLQAGVSIAGFLYLMVYFGSSLAGGAWLPVTMLATVVCLTLYQRNTYKPLN